MYNLLCKCFLSFQTLDLLAELCQQLQLGFLRLDGSTPATKRQSLVDQFNSSYSSEGTISTSFKPALQIISFRFMAMSHRFLL